MHSPQCLREKSHQFPVTPLTFQGTGKSYASAFALREMKAKKALFIVHREQIAKQTIKSYKRVFGNSKTFGLLSGNSKEINADYMFSTMQMMAKPEIYEQYKNDKVIRFRAVPEITHRKWKELNLMSPLKPDETPDFRFQELQMKLYYTIYL